MSRTFDWVASRYRDGSVTSDYEVVYDGTDLAYTVGYERGEVNLDGGSWREQTLRVTQIYRNENGQWRLCTATATSLPSTKARRYATTLPAHTSGECGRRWRVLGSIRRLGVGAAALPARSCLTPLTSAL